MDLRSPGYPALSFIRHLHCLDPPRPCQVLGSIIVQFPVNPIRPVFYEELMGELRDPSIPLRVIANKYCKEHELFNRMYSMYSLLKRAHDATKSIALGK